MATLSTLTQAGGPLTKITVPLGAREHEGRHIYGVEEFVRWAKESVPNLKTGRMNAPQTPLEQLDDILHRWIANDQLNYTKSIKDLEPAQDEVWELKTTDLRIFGWIYRKGIFIAVLGGYADHYKAPTRKLSYETAKQKVIKARDGLDLDEPKFIAGATNAELF